MSCWLLRLFAGSPPGLFASGSFAPWLVRPNEPGAKKPRGESARGRTSQGAKEPGANRQMAHMRDARYAMKSNLDS